MSEPSISSRGIVHATTVPLSPNDVPRELALRARFAAFWGSAQGEPRDIYDTFISATPMTSDVLLEQVDASGVNGWWVRPEGAPSDRAILYIHGGGYVVGSAKAYRGFVSQIASRTRLSVLVIDYPLAAEATVPAAPDAALRAYRWLQSTGIHHIAIVGDSAGGGLTLVTLARLAFSAADPPAVAGVAFSPWTDLALTGASLTDPAVHDPLIGYPYLQECARRYLGGVDARDAMASPLHGDLSRLPAVLVQVGTDELLLDDARAYAAKAAAAGAPIQLQIWEGMHHVFQLDVTHLHASRAALDRAAGFLTERFAQIRAANHRRSEG